MKDIFLGEVKHNYPEIEINYLEKENGFVEFYYYAPEYLTKDKYFVSFMGKKIEELLEENIKDFGFKSISNIEKYRNYGQKEKLESVGVNAKEIIICNNCKGTGITFAIECLECFGFGYKYNIKEKVMN